MKTIPAVLVAVVVAGCASAPRVPCDPATESEIVGGLPVFRACAVDKEAKFSRYIGGRPDWQPTPPFKDCYSALISVVVDTKGLPLMETAKIVRSSDRSFAEAQMTVVRRSIYTPAMKDGQPVQQRLENPISVQVGSTATRPRGSCTP